MYIQTPRNYKILNINNSIGNRPLALATKLIQNAAFREENMHYIVEIHAGCICEAWTWLWVSKQNIVALSISFCLDHCDRVREQIDCVPNSIINAACPVFWPEVDWPCLTSACNIKNARRQDYLLTFLSNWISSVWDIEPDTDKQHIQKYNTSLTMEHSDLPRWRSFKIKKLKKSYKLNNNN